MNKERAIRFVLDELAAGRSVADTAQTLAEMSPLDEAKARRFIELTQHEHNANSQQILSARERELAAYIVKAMGRHLDMNTIITQVTIQGNMSWSQAKVFINKTLHSNKRTVARRQMKFALPFALLVFLTGLAITVLFVGATYRVAVGDAELSALGPARLMRLMMQGPGMFLGGVFMTIGGARSIWRQLKTALVG